MLKTLLSVVRAIIVELVDQLLRRFPTLPHLLCIHRNELLAAALLLHGPNSIIDSI